MRRMTISLRLGLAVATLAAAAALGTAFAFEWWGGLVPCALCLVERWPYRVAIALGVIGVLLPRPFVRGALVAMLLTALVAVALAGTHVGVEFGWWPSPLPECAAPHFAGGSIAERLAHMPTTVAKPCDSPTFLIPGLPLSMAGMNLALGLAFGGFLAISLVRPARRVS